MNRKKQNLTKSDTLKFLKEKVNHSKIEKLIDFTVLDWSKNSTDLIKSIQKEFPHGKIIVRSSAIGEDSSTHSQAGKYQSVLNVNTKSKKEIKNAIVDVIQSYYDADNLNLQNKVLIQQQSTDIKISGVIFTRSEPNGSPYFTINYDAGKSTNTVTSGKITETIKIFRNIRINQLSKHWKLLIKSVKEIESILKSDFLDIEFGLTSNQVIIFQVRPLTIIPKGNFLKIDKKIYRIIFNNKHLFQKLSKPRIKLDSKTAFSDMSDWNPSEIIGNNPNLLDYSLYSHLITNDAWALGRSIMEYKKIANYPLMVKFGNKPYVDLRASFNSLIPKTIPTKIQKKLLNYYFLKIENCPYLHDKIEFSIIFSCYDFLFESRRSELLKSGISKNEINELKKELISFTNNLINSFPKHSTKLELSLRHMSKNRKKILLQVKKSHNYYKSLLNAALLLLDDCKSFGTIPFSTMARYAFVGNTIFKSLLISSQISDIFFKNFMNSIKTPLTEYKEDLEALSQTKLSKKLFMKKYGHLRPGTYDITVPRYDSNSNFFENIFTIQKNKSKPKHNLQFQNIKNFSNLQVNSKEFLAFVKNSTVLREKSKFEFTKNLSDSLEFIAEAGALLGFSRNDMANLSLKQILQGITMSKKNTKLFWMKQILKEKNRRKIHNFLILPPLIFNSNNFEIIEYFVSRPNYISTQKISGMIVKLDQLTKIPKIENQIVLIENADPGFDWIFTKNPLALITKYGGVASHIAIRCAEVNLPAAIGCGEILYDKLLNSEKILLDCQNQQITILENKISDSETEAKKILKLLGYIK